jgi:hypothetical protein
MEKLNTVELYISGTGYPDQIVPSDKFVGNSTKLTCLVITGYWIKCSSVMAQVWSKGLDAGTYCKW